VGSPRYGSEFTPRQALPSDFFAYFHPGMAVNPITKRDNSTQAELYQGNSKAFFGANVYQI